MIKKFCLVVFSFLVFCTSAAADDALVCLKETAKQEKENKIQTNLLSAIALAESGRYSKNYPSGIAWPWTVTTVDGGYFFETKKEAIEKVRRLRNEGITSIDVGCMQVNLKFHPNAFESLEDALDPAKNVAYAAEFLKRNHKETGSWGIAATRYHSKTTHKAFKYEDKLLNIWRRLAQHGNPAKPETKATVKDISKEAANKISNKVFKPKKAPVQQTKTIKPGSEESKALAAQWRKEKLEAYMAKKKKEDQIYQSEEPIFEVIPSLKKQALDKTN